MRRAHPFLIAVVACLVLASATAAAQPQMERVTVNEIGVQDPFLTDYCGFDVFFDFTGHFTLRLFTDADGNPTREVNNFAQKARIYSAWGSVSIVDVGPDRITYNADGSITDAITGNVQSIQLPGQGRVWSNVGVVTLLVSFPPEGDPVVDVISQVGQHSDSAQEDVLCAALSP